MTRESELNNNLSSVLGEINGKANLIAVSKTFPLTDVEVLYRAGHFDFGENKVQDLEAKALKAQELGINLHWHFIGSLQSNKAKKLLSIPGLRAIHSIDSVKLLKQLLKYESSLSEAIDCFIQINTSGEAEKSGFDSIEQLDKVVELFQTSKFLKLTGLMTIGTIRTDNFEEDAQKCFKTLINHRDKMQDTYSLELKLSMGMSSDYMLAIANGSDYVRVGSKIFGNRV